MAARFMNEFFQSTNFLIEKYISDEQRIWPRAVITEQNLKTYFGLHVINTLTQAQM